MSAGKDEWPTWKPLDTTEFARSDWVKDSRHKVKAPPRGSATYCAKGTGGVKIRKTLDYFWVSESLGGKA